MQVDDQEYASNKAQSLVVKQDERQVRLIYDFGLFEAEVTYDLETEGLLKWHIALRNKQETKLEVQSFYVWCSVAYVMFRDTDVHRNINQSCALFPSIAGSYSKFACVRRSNQGPHLGIYSLEGSTISSGSYCRYENNFFKQVSPSLDGVLYHNFVLAGKGSANEQDTASDWIYMKDVSPITMTPGETRTWSYAFIPFESQQQFYDNGFKLGHPILKYDAAVPQGEQFSASIQVPEGHKIDRAWLDYVEDGFIQMQEVIDNLFSSSDGKIKLDMRMHKPGEHKLVIEFDNGNTDFVVFNVMPPVAKMIESRAKYLCDNLYVGEEGETPYHFAPESNQGESLGKLTLILLKNQIGTFDNLQVRKVENSAVYYIKPKWFENGDFYKPVKLYGQFYRIYDLDYIGHVYFLLSQFKDEQLMHNTADEYLRWAAEVMIVRLDSNLHEDEREKKEAQMLGIFIMYMNDLLTELQQRGMIDAYNRLSGLWIDTGKRMLAESEKYTGAITEHFYDNAGFGPTCEAMCLTGNSIEAVRYGELLLANIGFSNDFRAQNPDRWWEALAYMVHSLWGGMVAASTLVAYEHIRKNDYLLAAYRSTVPVFYCYDWNATAMKRKLMKGEAASTYCVASPNMNRPDLSRERFGQGVFVEDSKLFGDLFSNATGDDWDMGQELVAYLKGFGTKTFLYYDNGEICCVNGKVEKQGDNLVITSYAAYPKNYYFFEEGASFTSEIGELAPKVIYADGKFVRLTQ